MGTTHSYSIPEPTWSDPTVCPFCGDQLADGGAGFMDHIDENAACASGFEMWRNRVITDMSGEWSG